jgi:hypothetical protein
MSQNLSSSIHESLSSILLARSFTHRPVATPRPRRRERAGDRVGQLGQLERLREAAVGACVHRQIEEAFRAVTGQQDDGELVVACMECAQHLEAIHARHGEVGDDHIDVGAVDR